ncbi:MAG: bifunctional homocysteine S-methyltransferase/methylenetetrahydrofolate reductase [Gemmatimonadota bacterium]
MPDFRDALDRERVVLFDGAMGTQLYERGVFINRCYDDLSRSEPESVREIHAAYRDAGAEVLETNTFGANRYQLQSHGLEEEVGAINRAGAGLAREVAGDELFVAGSMGPLGVRLEPYGPTSRGEARDAFAEQARALAEGGVDVFVLETFADLDELEQAVAGCRDASGLPVVAMMTIQPDGETTYGARPRRIAREVEGFGADAAGLNCSVGPAILLEAIREMSSATSLPLSALPNAGLPQEVQGRKMYLASPEYMASYARRLAEAGARVVGGCCGTGPDHVREMAAQLRALSSEPTLDVASPSPEDEAEPAPEPADLADRSEWGRNIAAGEEVVSVELPPPKGSDAASFVAAGKRVREAGADAVSIPDKARASMRMGVLAAAALLHREAGVEAVAHYTCRDRNLLGMATDLLGAEALGVRNLLLVTGDPPRMGPYGEATGVFDIDSIGLTNLVSRLNRGRDLGGNPMGSRTSFVAGVAVNPGAVDLDREKRRWHWKVDAGADFAVTQPVFDPDELERFLDHAEAEGSRIPVVAGLWPLTGLRDAEFLNYEVPGIRVPDQILGRMAEAEESGPDAARREGLAVARETLARIRGRVEGVQITAPSGRLEPVLELLRELRPERGGG